MPMMHALVGGKTIRIITESIKDKIVIEISDDGVGISEANVGKVFDPFFTTKSPQEGTGLGLSIVHAIIKDMDGEITVESALDKGTTFKITLPMKQEAQPEEEKEPEISKTNDEVTFADLSGKVLLLEDEVHIRSSLATLLECFGLDVFEVESSHDALELLESVKDSKNNFDLILTDYKLPGLSEDELIDEFLKRKSESTKLILISGCFATNDMEKQRKVVEEKVDLFIEKPFTKEKIYKAVSSLLNK